MLLILKDYSKQLSWHDLDLNNLKFLKDSLSNLFEVSIGHALISDALYYGLEKTIKMYLNELK
jgi:pyridoxine 5-phosphate synthase